MAILKLWTSHDPTKIELNKERFEEKNGDVWSAPSLRVDGMTIDIFLTPRVGYHGDTRELENVKTFRTAIAQLLKETDELIQIAEERAEELAKERVGA